MKNLTKILTVAGISLGLSFYNPNPSFSQNKKKYLGSGVGVEYNKGEAWQDKDGVWHVPEGSKLTKGQWGQGSQGSSSSDLEKAAVVIGGVLFLKSLLDNSTNSSGESSYESNSSSGSSNGESSEIEHYKEKEKTYEKWWKEDSESNEWYVDENKNKNEWHKEDSKEWWKEEKTSDGISVSVPWLIKNKENKKEKYGAKEFFFEEPNTKKIEDSKVGFVGRTGETFKWLFVQPFTGFSESFNEFGEEVKKENGMAYKIAGNLSKSIGNVIPRTPAGVASLAAGNIGGSMALKTITNVASESTKEGGLEEWYSKKSEHYNNVMGESNYKGLYIISSQIPGVSDILQGIEYGIETEKDIRNILQ
jgi:hypothetical protein